MENTPLGQAYDNAKNAIIYRDSGSLSAAKESHEQAASNYGTAADQTEDFEAVRLLSLLQEHHKELAKVLAAVRSTKSGQTTTAEISVELPPETTQLETTPAIEAKETTDAHRPKANPALATISVKRQPRRDLASSIASNLATARGKPAPNRRSEPLPPNVTAQHAGGKLVSRTQDRGHIVSRAPRQIVDSTPIPEQRSDTDPFSRFYSSLHGLYSKLPGSLAFTGLPVSIAEETEAQASLHQDNKQKDQPNRATAEPEYSAIFSPSTIRAVNKETGTGLASHESFYVVPTSGGTRSYAGIVTGRENETAELLADEDGDEFEDAREHLGPPSPKASRTSQILRRRQKAEEVKSSTGKTMEELDLENGALRQLVDQQNRRLQMWEASAQSQSMALAQSMRLNRQAPSTRSNAPLAESEQVKKLEEDLYAERTQREAVEHQYEKMERENEKLLLQVSNLRKYKERWERLKETARQKQRDREGRSDGGADAIRLA